jgi:hypothetical protein
MIVYAPRVTVHPDRYGADRSRQVPMVKWLILHTSEQSGAEDVNDAEDLARFMTTAGDRPSSSGGFYGASYHAVSDTDRVLPCTEDHLVAFAAGGANRYGLHLCLPVRIRARSTTDPDANVSRAEWLDAGSRPYIRQAAEWIVDKALLYRIPLVRITPQQMAAGALGYCDHHTASLAFRKSDHTDVGAHFPWDVLAADIASIIEPPKPPDPPPVPDQETDMAHISGIRLRINDRDGNRYHDQVVALTIGNPEQLHKIGAADDRLIEANLNATRAEIEAELGFKLSPM